MCVRLRRVYRSAQLVPSVAGGFAAAAVLNVLTPADWSVSQEVELAVVELATALCRQVGDDVVASVEVTVHSAHIEIVVGAESDQWITDSVRIRPRRPFESSVECSVERPGPPPARPALWPELGVPRGREEWSAAYAELSLIMQSVRGGSELTPTLDAIASAVVNATCFTVVAVNLVRPDGQVEVVSVCGSDSASRALLGVVERVELWQELIARSTGWGSLRFARGNDPLPVNTVMTSWQDSHERQEHGWNPDDSLFAPLYADGHFIGALSVDLPAGAPRPSVEDLSKLEVFAEHAAVAIERARRADAVPEVG